MVANDAAPNGHAAPSSLANGHSTKAGNDDMASVAAQRPPINSTGDAFGYPMFSSKEEERRYVKFRLAQAFRIFGALKYDERMAGHITMRDPIDPDCFWVNPFGKHFSLIQPSDLILVDHEGNILPESGPLKRLNIAAFMIHSAVHRARPDVNCAAHSHSMYGKTWSAFGEELEMLTQDTCAFYNDHAVYKNFGGVVFDMEEGNRIAECLGGKKAAILQNHGLLVATPSIEATIAYYITLEKCCQVQLLADAAAAGRGKRPKPISDEEAQGVWEVVGNVHKGFFSGMLEIELLEEKEGVRWVFDKDRK